MTIVLAIAAPVIIGFADHIGVGLSRRGRPMVLVFWLYTSSVPFTVAAAVLIGGSPTVPDLALGALAGAFAATALMALYKGYSESSVGVVAPVAAVTGAVVPIAAATIISGFPSRLVQLGLVVGLIAVWFIGFDRSGAAIDNAALLYGTLAGVFFGGMSVTLGLTAESAGIYPLIATRAVSVPLMFTVLRVRGLSAARDRNWDPRLLLVIGIAAALGPAAFTIAAQQNLAVAGLFMQMAYGFTVLFQVLLAGERATKAQVIGFGLAIMSLTMISLG